MSDQEGPSGSMSSKLAEDVDHEVRSGNHLDHTTLSEQQLAWRLLRALERSSPGATIRHDQLLYYRSSTNAEIDFVSRDLRRTCFEAKYVDSG